MNAQSSLAQFEAEIDEVQGTLLSATTDLTNPLGELVRGQIKRAQPPICGATVLAVSYLAGNAAEKSDLRRKRILLAAALEMLNIALNVHRLLVNAALAEPQPNGDDALDRAFIGSTILAGDYCFSRAAQLAAQTDHPRVVATFSLALQTVSEELLREQFHSGNGSGSYDETRQLLQSGALAAAQLVGLPEAEQQNAVALSRELAAQWPRFRHSNDMPNVQSSNNNSLHTLPANWQILYLWLNRQHANSGLL